MKKTLIAISLLMLVGCGNTSEPTADEEKIIELESQIEDLQDQIDTMQTEHEDRMDEIDDRVFDIELELGIE